MANEKYPVKRGNLHDVRKQLARWLADIDDRIVNAQTVPHQLYGIKHTDVFIGDALAERDLLAFEESDSKFHLQTRLNWRGNWQPVEYHIHDCVWDDGWLMAANKTTEERAAPQPQGDPYYLYDGTNMTLQSTTAKQIVFGQEFTSLEPGYVLSYGIRSIAGNRYEIILVRDPAGANEAEFVNSYTAETSGWRNFSLVPRPVAAGTTFRLLAIVNEPDPAPVTVTANYDYQKPQNITLPATGQAMHSGKALGNIYFHPIDADGTDQTTLLTGLSAGDVITGGTTRQLWAVQAVEDHSADPSPYIRITVAPAQQGSGAGVVEFRFETTAPVPMSYFQETDYFLTTPNISGLFISNGSWEDVVADDNAYGVDLLVQEAYLSPDWDFLSVPESGYVGGDDAGYGFWSAQDDNIYNNNEGNVGIGTTNPETPLQINAPINPISASPQAGSLLGLVGGSLQGASISLVADPAWHCNLLFGDSDDANVGRIRYSNSDDAMSFRTNDVDRMWIDADGKVGIGTASPGTPLYVEADGSELLQLRPASVDGAAYMAFANDVGANKVLIGRLSGGLDWGYFRSTGSGLIFQTNGANERMRIDADGKVGIGTTIPGRALSVFSSEQIVATFKSSNATQGGISLRDADTSTDAHVRLSAADDDMVFHAGAFERMRIDADGNVGIGTTSPWSPLSVKSPTASTVAASFGYSGTQGRVDLGILDTWHGAINLYTSGNANAVHLTSVGDSWMNGGNVGIGTATPESIFQVKQSANCQVLLTSGDTSQAILSLGDATNPYVGRVLYDNSDNSMRFNTSSVERMRITSTGNVGIGTTNPAEKLDVAGGMRVGALSGSSEGGQITLRDKDGADSWYFDVDAAGDGRIINPFDGDSNLSLGIYNAGTGYIRFRTNNTERVRITSDGSVGIGTTNPVVNLHLNNTGGATQRISGGASQIASLQLYSGTDNTRIYQSGVNLTFQQVSAGYTRFLTNNTERMRITSDGKVGIGTTNPVDPLHIGGRIRLSGVAGETPNSNNNYFRITHNASAGGDYGCHLAHYLNGVVGASIQIGDSGQEGIFFKVGTGNDTAVTIQADGDIQAEGGAYFGGAPRPIGATLEVTNQTALGSTAWSNLPIFQLQAGNTTNDVILRTWILRDAAGSDWTTTRFHTAVSVDNAFTVPRTNTRAWKEVDPNSGSHHWGSAGTEYMTLSSTGLLTVDRLITDGVTGGDKGAGTINVSQVYINGSPIATFVDAPADGTIYGRKDNSWVSIGASAGTVSDLSLSRTATTNVILNTGGDNVTLLAASDTLAGLMTSTQKSKLDGIEAGATKTDLSLSRTATTNVISNTGGDGVTLLAADDLNAGLMTSTQKDKLDGIEAGANDYTHPSYTPRTASVDTGAMSGATVISDLDFNTFVDDFGHVTSANAVVATRELTAEDIGATDVSITAGLYTPTFNLGGTTSGSVVVTRIGNQVLLSGRITWTTAPSGTGQLTISLPYSCAYATGFGLSSNEVSVNIGAANGMMATIDAGQSIIKLWGMNEGGNRQAIIGNWINNNGYIDINVNYYTNDPATLFAPLSMTRIGD